MKLICRSIIFIAALLFITSSTQAERFDKFIQREGNNGKSRWMNEELLDIIADPKPLSEQGEDFRVNIELEGAGKAFSIKGINSFRVERTDTADENTLYAVVYFLDNRPVEVFKRVTLPFTFKRDFRGISDGGHTLSFKVVDRDGKTGAASVRITVRH